MNPLTGSQQAERIVIGASLLSRDSLIEATAAIKPEHFDDPLHKRVWAWATKRAEVGQAIDLVTLADVIKTTDLVRLSEYPDQALGLGVTLSGAIETLHRGALLRHYRGAAESIYAAVKANDTDAAQVALERAQEGSDSLSSAKGGAVHVSVAVDEMMEFAEQRQQRIQDGETVGCPTGFTALDEAMDGGGLGGELIVTAARPGMGKTADIVQSGLYQARHVGPVCIFSLEMKRRELAGRMLAAEADVNMRRALTGELSQQDWDALDTAAQKIYELPLYIDDRAALTVNQIASEARRIKRIAGGLASLKIDYLQLMTGKGQNREQEVSGITKRLKELAKELDVPIDLLAQLNRSCEARQDKRPMMSDLRESGGIEQDADFVIMLYRDEYYSPDTTPDPNMIELLIRKARRAQPCTVKLGWKWGRIFNEIPTRTANMIGRDVGGQYGM